MKKSATLVALAGVLAAFGSQAVMAEEKPAAQMAKKEMKEAGCGADHSKANEGKCGASQDKKVEKMGKSAEGKCGEGKCGS
ncbi:hypothetical protein [Pelistega europaea]|uniref:Low-complexity protein n=1 Tax=Pelistega europaea TaxID=106147 RepID=A0A7Y4LD54_9BURK|nr:hypothetical protein [Pelistega europaea]NOL50241.1 hypothetical protein [Pelistega europaea]